MFLTCIVMQVTNGIVDMEAANTETIAELEIPGTCYIKLLHQIPAELLTGRQLCMQCSILFIFLFLFCCC